MQEKDILGFAIDRGAAVNTYWNIYIAVVTAVLGVMASGEDFTDNKHLKVVLTSAFIVFAYSNLTAILRLGRLRAALLRMLPQDRDVYEAILKSLSPASGWVYGAFHTALDLVVLAAIWIVPWA